MATQSCFTRIHLNPQTGPFLGGSRRILEADYISFCPIQLSPPHLSSSFPLVSIGDALEEAWGSFHLNLFFLIGIVAVVLVSFLQPSIPINPFYLHNSLFLAFATTMPDQKVFFFPLPIPLSVRWVAAITSGLLFLPAFFQPILFPSIFAGLAGYIAFFFPPFLESIWERFRNRGS